jgi:hypothetical protein
MTMEGSTIMENIPLVVNCWVQRQASISQIAEQIATCFVNVVQWQAPDILSSNTRTVVQRHPPDLPEQEPGYFFVRTWDSANQPLGGQQLDHNPVVARRQVQERDVRAVQLNVPSDWRNPYVRAPDVYDNQMISIRVIQQRPESNEFEVEIWINDKNLWFDSCPGNAEVLYSSYSFVQDYLTAKYELFPNDKFNRGDRQAYVPSRKLSRANRRQFVEGMGQFIHHFVPEATIVVPALPRYSSSLPTRYDRATQTFSLRNPRGVAASAYDNPDTRPPHPYLYHIPPGRRIAEEWLAGHVYFPHTVAGVEMQLEEEVFGFLREESLDDEH